MINILKPIVYLLNRTLVIDDSVLYLRYSISVVFTIKVTYCIRVKCRLFTIKSNKANSFSFI